MNYTLAKRETEIKEIEMMASVVWPIAYKSILHPEQIQYMLDKFLSLTAIQENIKNGYTYILLSDENKNKAGFLAYCLQPDKIFLSKLYLLPTAQNKGYSSEIIRYLKSFKLPIELTVNKYNKNAYEKYLHLGFKVIDSVVTDIGNKYYMDDFVMRLD